MIQEAGVRFKKSLPENVRDNVIFEMMDPSTISQLEDAWMDAGRKGLLIPNYFVRTDIETVRGGVADVGRYDPADRRNVLDWHRGRGRHHVFGALVGVLPQKLAA